MKSIIQLFLVLFIFLGAGSAQTFYKGADLSYVKELEGCGVQWKESNTAKDIFSIFQDHGANIIRFRLWHTPTLGKNGYADTESMIARAKGKGLRVILDFHYSDTWADAGKQRCPAAWMAVVNNNSVLADSIYNYTRKTLQALKDKGLLPEFVQVGNETNGGMCFPGDGTVTWPTDWSKQTLLFNAGIKAVNDVDAGIKVILHVADPKNAEWWAGQLNSNNVNGYDILGISFYPTWHTVKTINDFGNIITNIKNTYSKEVMVVETGLPWTSSWDDNTTNIMSGVPSGYGSSPSPEIQAQWLTDLYHKMIATGGIGIVYWEPEWVASHTNCPAESGGSVWENIALFDFGNNLMLNGGIKFCKLSTGISELNSRSDEFSLNVFPNPAQDELNIEFTARSSEEVLMEIIDRQGKVVKSFIRKPVVGMNQYRLNVRNFNTITGLYMLRLHANGKINSRSFIISR